jgi:hypothetical protein
MNIIFLYSKYTYICMYIGSWFGHNGTELIDSYMGTPLVREMIDDGTNAADIYDKAVKNELEQFIDFRSQFLLYA